MGLHVAETGGDTLQLVGNIHGGHVTVTRGDDRSGRCQWTIEVAHDEIPKSLGVRAERGSALGRLLEGKDVQTGDVVFDEQVRVVGDEAEVLALMRERARRKVADWASRGARVHNQVTLWRGLDSPQSLNILSRAKGLGTLAATLRLDEEEIPLLLARNVLRDRAIGVRVRSLRVLVTHDLPTELEQPQVVRLLEDALNERDEDLHEIAGELVSSLCATDPAMFESLGEGGLIAALGNRALRDAALERLEEVGTERCVSAVLEITTGLFVGSDLKAAGKAVIAKIVARVGDLTGGGLSVVARPEDGQLSVTTGEGALSKAD